MTIYEHKKAVAYADRWWNEPNPQFPYFKNDDCTNFISQCLYAGGMPMLEGSSRTTGWWIKAISSTAWNWSFSWTVAHSLHWHLRSGKAGVRVQLVPSVNDLIPGDLIQYDWTADGRINHSAIVTARNQTGEPLVNAHTRSAFHRPWRYQDSPAWTEQTRYYFFHFEIP